jgi:nitrite reductase/ring-hydroxylating ferredoxin subunit
MRCHVRNAHEHEHDVVATEDACPHCGERSIDSLVWIDDEIVRCLNCGTRYEPLARGGDDATEA